MWPLQTFIYILVVTVDRAEKGTAAQARSRQAETEMELRDDGAAGLLPFVDILSAAAHPGLQWSATELVVAFQWANTVQQLPGPTAAALRTALQSAKLPPWLAGCGPALAQHPRAVLLLVLLQRAPHDSAWLQLVLAGYIGACVLPLPQTDRAGAEADLAGVLAQLGQQQLLGLAASALVAEAGAEAAAAVPAAGAAGPSAPGLAAATAVEQAGLRRAALGYFISGPNLAAAAAAQLLLQALGARSVSLHDFLGTRPSLLELEVLCLGVLLPAWEQVLQRLQQGSGPPATRDMSDVQGSLAAWQTIVRQLCELCGSQYELLLRLPPPLLAEVCRASFQFTCCFAAVLEAAALGQDVPHLVAAHVRQLLQYNDMVSIYISRKLSIGSSSIA